ncbi:MAG: hypothetical protein QW151_04535, partial [Thermoplasmata archaeon]
STNINSYGDRAYMNLSSVWSQDIYVDDYGNVFWVDNWGNVFFRSTHGNVYFISTPYNYFSFAGRIVSISVINDRYVDYVALLTEYGFVFVYDMNSGTWFNATKVWNLNLQSVWSLYHSPWTSVTSNLLGDYNGYHELFIFTNLNGEVYAFDTTYNATSRTNYGGWWNSTPTQYKIISTVAFYDEITKSSGHLYGIAFNGTVYYFNNSWTILVNSSIKNITGITLGYYYSKNNTIYYTLYIVSIQNDTQIYQYNPNTNTFQSYGSKVDSLGSNQAITFDMYSSLYGYNYWYVLQTNGTVAYTNNGANANSWSYLDNYPPEYNTGFTLKLQSYCSLNFTTSLIYYNSKNPWNMYNFTVYFTGSNNVSNLEFYYYWPTNTIKNPANFATLSSNGSMYINFTYMPNMAFNSTFYFYILLNSQNSIILTYTFTINIINHYNYIPI